MSHAFSIVFLCFLGKQMENGRNSEELTWNWSTQNPNKISIKVKTKPRKTYQTAHRITQPPLNPVSIINKKIKIKIKEIQAKEVKVLQTPKDPPSPSPNSPRNTPSPPKKTIKPCAKPGARTPHQTIKRKPQETKNKIERKEVPWKEEVLRSHRAKKEEEKMEEKGEREFRRSRDFCFFYSSTSFCVAGKTERRQREKMIGGKE